jgi:ATP-binding cassette subfamily C protein
MRLILTLARAYPWRSAGIVFCLLLGSAVTGLGTAAMLPTLAALAAGGNGRDPVPASELEAIVMGWLSSFGLEASLGVLILLMIAMALARAALVIPTNRLIGNAVARFARDLRIRLVRAITQARWSYLTGQRVGVLSAGFAAEADRSAGAFLAATTLVAEAMKVALFVALASLVSWKITAGGLAIGALLVVGLASFVRAARRAGAKQTRLTREALSRLQSTFVSLKPFKAMARETTLGALLDSDTDRLFRTLKRLVMTKETLRALQETLIALTIAGLAFGVLHFLEMPFQSLLPA